MDEMAFCPYPSEPQAPAPERQTKAGQGESQYMTDISSRTYGTAQRPAGCVSLLSISVEGSLSSSESLLLDKVCMLSGPIGIDPGDIHVVPSISSASRFAGMHRATTRRERRRGSAHAS